MTHPPGDAKKARDPRMQAIDAQGHMATPAHARAAADDDVISAPAGHEVALV